MKKNGIILILSIIIVIQFILINNLNHNKAVNTSKSEINSKTEELNKNIDIKNSYLMNNPIDNYYVTKLTSNIAAEVRDNQDEYEKTWEKEYFKVINLIKNKCIYEIDIENLDNLYRDACMLLIPYLEGEYEFPY